MAHEGDIAAFPEPTTGELARIEHWNVRMLNLLLLPPCSLDGFDYVDFIGGAKPRPCGGERNFREA